MRTFSVSRPVDAERILRVTLDFSGGTLAVMPGRPGQLYSAQLRYDPHRFMPVQQFDPATGTLRLALESSGGAVVKVTSRAPLQQSGKVELPRDIPLELEASIGASDASIDLGGTILRRVSVSSGASHTAVDFSRPTQGECASATFTVGLGHIDILHLAQSGCAQIRVEGGVGGATLSFDGVWRRDLALEASLAMGGLTLRIPAGTGVRVSAQRFLSPFDATGFVREGKLWITPDYAKAVRKLNVDIKASMAGVSVEWIKN